MRRAFPKLRKMSLHATALRRSAGSDSRRRRLPASSRQPSASRMQKMPCQPITSAKVPPTIGATTGAMPFMAPIRASIRARSRPENLSVATEREMTMPPEPATPCTKRIETNCPMFVARTQSSVEPMKSHMAASNGLRRPYLSLKGPKSSCPAARPAMLVVRPVCTIDEEVWKYSVMAGSAGRYMSVTKGPNAVSMPSRMSRNVLELPLFIISF